MNLRDKVVLVTGGAIGIGKATVLEFAKAGTNVVINYNSSEKQANDLIKEVEKFGVNAIAVKADVSKEAEVKKLFIAVIEKFGKIDILVNNAGNTKGGHFTESDLDLWKDQFENILMSAVICSREFMKLNKAEKQKKIINVSSIFGFNDKGDRDVIQYCAMKAALNNFTVNLAKFAAPNCLVNAVAPGYTYTPQWDKRSAEFNKSCIDETMIKRFIEASEIAEVILMLAKNDAMIGQVVLVDGGLALK